MGQRQFGSKSRRRTTAGCHNAGQRPHSAVASKYFSSDEAAKLFRDFVNDHPSGIIDEGEFVDAYATFFPFGNSRPLSRHIFRAIDRSGNGYITFGEYLSVLGVTQRGSPVDKLKFAFLVYDIDGSGAISQEEFCEIRTSLDALKPAAVNRGSNSNSSSSSSSSSSNRGNSSSGSMQRRVSCSYCQLALADDVGRRTISPGESVSDLYYPEFADRTQTRRASTLQRQRSLSMVSLSRPSLTQSGACATMTSSPSHSSSGSPDVSPLLSRLAVLEEYEDDFNALVVTSSPKYRSSPSSPHYGSNACEDNGTTWYGRRSSTLSSYSSSRYFTSGSGSELESAEYMYVFDEIDTNKDGFITFDEFQSAATRDPTLSAILDVRVD